MVDGRSPNPKVIACRDLCSLLFSLFSACGWSILLPYPRPDEARGIGQAGRRRRSPVLGGKLAWSRTGQEPLRGFLSG